MNAEKKIVKISISALFSAILAICSWISVPMPSGIALTLQTFGVALCGYILGARTGTAAYIVYLLCGISGLPVFSSFGAGIGKLFGITGGYLWGFTALIITCGFSKKSESMVLRLTVGIFGLFICHICGIIQFSFVSGNSFVKSAVIASTPYIIKDSAMVAAAAFTAKIFERKIKSLLK